ncbi:MAG: biotin--[acetyl-CoA-carboxylase] ligase [Hyphomicrobiaceae bacterium]|nr:biotin--[acetyl-CoA-carboxylase] ligase [Hyphomicrobiaceae bacterium]
MKTPNSLLPQGYQYFWSEEIDSTNLEAFRKRDNGLTGDSWFGTKRQIGGRGSRGKQWVSSPGNLYASLLTHSSCSSQQLPQISVLAALAAYSAIEQFAGDYFRMGSLCLKWPNDILLEGRKICGILVESRPSSTRAGQFDVVMGTGINLASHPEAHEFKDPDANGLFAAGHLAQNGWDCSIEQLFVALAQSTRDWRSIWANGAGFETVRLAWLERSCHIGQTIKISVGERLYEGRFKTISSEGALLLEDLSGSTQEISSGSIIEIKGLE